MKTINRIIDFLKFFTLYICTSLMNEYNNFMNFDKIKQFIMFLLGSNHEIVDKEILISI